MWPIPLKRAFPWERERWWRGIGGKGESERVSSAATDFLEILDWLHPDIYVVHLKVVARYVTCSVSRSTTPFTEPAGRPVSCSSLFPSVTFVYILSAGRIRTRPLLYIMCFAFAQQSRASENVPRNCQGDPYLFVLQSTRLYLRVTNWNWSFVTVVVLLQFLLIYLRLAILVSFERKVLSEKFSCLVQVTFTAHAT